MPLNPCTVPRTVRPALCRRFKGKRMSASDGSKGSIHLGSSVPHVMSIYVIYCLRKGETLCDLKNNKNKNAAVQKKDLCWRRYSFLEDFRFKLKQHQTVSATNKEMPPPPTTIIQLVRDKNVWIC